MATYDSNYPSSPNSDRTATDISDSTAKHLVRTSQLALYHLGPNETHDLFPLWELPGPRRDLLAAIKKAVPVDWNDPASALITHPSALFQYMPKYSGIIVDEEEETEKTAAEAKEKEARAILPRKSTRKKSKNTLVLESDVEAKPARAPSKTQPRKSPRALLASIPAELRPTPRKSPRKHLTANRQQDPTPERKSPANGEGGAFICKDCGKDYLMRSSLVRHMKTHGENITTCPLCPSKEYSIFWELKK
ncbi:hypothetical protein EDC01DRAFT_635880 [Geopyxis carbonaria]|nr:hypothetical protein EDC01DRAFT_635880 [Geopyxis carbonaria]